MAAVMPLKGQAKGRPMATDFEQRSAPADYRRLLIAWNALATKAQKTLILLGIAAIFASRCSRAVQ
jgi:hypothetical protein